MRQWFGTYRVDGLLGHAARLPAKRLRLQMSHIHDKGVADWSHTSSCPCLVVSCVVVGSKCLPHRYLIHSCKSRKVSHVLVSRLMQHNILTPYCMYLVIQHKILTPYLLKTFIAMQYPKPYLVYPLTKHKILFYVSIDCNTRF